MISNAYVTAGRSGLRVSPFTLGTMTFGEDAGWGTSPAEAAAILAAYLDRGGNSIDTANIYTGGHSEKIIGDWFTAHPGRRDRVVLGTKFFGNLYPGDPNGGGAGRKGIAQQLENSLLERTSEAELIPAAQGLGLGVLPWSPLKNGFLSGKYARGRGAPADSARAALPGVFGTPSEDDYQVIEAVRQIAAELEVSPAAVALAWVQGRPGITSVIIGARRAGQLEANLAALDVTLTPDQRRRLDEASAPQLGFPAVVNQFAGRLAFGGTTVDGQSWDTHPALATATTRY